jgi:spore maturation protein CgeB
MGNRLPDREQRVHDFFFRAARLAPELRFVLGGSGWGQDVALPPNVHYVGHVPTAEHRAWNCSARMVLNVTREDMVRYGYSPPTRVFEVAGCGACLITDAWTGVDSFFQPDEEILVAASAEDVVGHLHRVSAARAHEIGRRARARVVRDHTYDQRAEALEQLLLSALAGHHSAPLLARVSHT